MADEAKESEPKSELPQRRQAAELQEFALTVRESFTFSTSLWLLLSLLLGLFPSLYDSSTENNNFSDRLPLTFTLFYLGSCISSIYRQPIPDPYGIIDERWTENLNKLQERVPKLIGMTQKTQILYLVFNLFFLKTGLYPFLVQLTGEIFITKRNQSRAEDNEELNRQLKEFLEKYLPDSFTVEEIEDEIPKKTQSLYEYLRDFIPTKTVFTAPSVSICFDGEDVLSDVYIRILCDHLLTLPLFKKVAILYENGIIYLLPKAIDFPIPKKPEKKVTPPNIKTGPTGVQTQSITQLRNRNLHKNQPEETQEDDLFQRKALDARWKAANLSLQGLRFLAWKLGLRPEEKRYHYNENGLCLIFKTPSDDSELSSQIENLNASIDDIDQVDGKTYIYLNVNNKKELQTLRDGINQLFSNKKTVSVAKSAAPASSSSPTRNDQEDSKDAEVTTDPAFRGPKQKTRGYFPNLSAFPQLILNRAPVHRFQINGQTAFWQDPKNHTPGIYLINTIRDTDKPLFAYIPPELKERAEELGLTIHDDDILKEATDDNATGVTLFHTEINTAPNNTKRVLLAKIKIPRSKLRPVALDANANLLIFSKFLNHSEIEQLRKGHSKIPTLSSSS